MTAKAGELPGALAAELYADNLALRAEIDRQQYAGVARLELERDRLQAELDKLTKPPNGIGGVSVWEERDKLLLEKASLRSEVERLREELNRRPRIHDYLDRENHSYCFDLHALNQARRDNSQFCPECVRLQAELDKIQTGKAYFEFTDEIKRLKAAVERVKAAIKKNRNRMDGTICEIYLLEALEGIGE
jgi:hypothetical protein